MRTALFGGTFDPLHRAHLTVATEAANQFALDRVLFIPGGNPPHKSTSAAFEDRYQMVKLACTVDSRFMPSRLEEGQARSYSIDTIERVFEQHLVEPPLLFIIGADAFEEIETWRRWREVIALVEFIVVARPGHKIAVPAGALVHRLETLALTVSSSDIRKSLAKGAMPEEVPETVAAYIRAHNLYRDEASDPAPSPDS